MNRFPERSRCIGIAQAAIGAFACFVLVALNAAYATTYYVSNSGNDSNSGTSPADAWKTIAKVNSEQFHPGDTILFDGGQSFSGNLELTSSGTAASPITVGSYGAQSATIDAGAGSGILWYNAGGITVEDLVFQGSGSSSNKADGVALYTDRGAYTAIDIENIAAHGFQEGVYVGTAGGTYSNVTIANVTAYDNGDTGIFVDNSAVWPKLNTSNLAIRSITANGNGAWGIQIEGVEGGTVENSVAYGNGDIGMWSWAADHIVFQEDVAHDNGGRDGGFDLDVGTTNSTIQYSYSYDNGGSGYQVCNYYYNPDTAYNTIRYNISENNYGSGSGLELDGDGDTIHGLYYYNNTVYHDVSAGDYLIAEYTPADHFIIANNIVVGGTSSVIAALWAEDPMTLDYDDWSGELGDFWYDDAAYGNYNIFRSGTGKEAHGRNVDPEFIGTPGIKNPTVYQLAPDSPLLGAGVDMLKTYHIDPGKRDFYGNPLPLTGFPSTGADEGSSAVKVGLNRYPGSLGLTAFLYRRD